ncbi:aldehyde dehydrogenase (NADP(+)) [Allokutzneria sp. A3M-2-11 16]|uniref:aldehyde dehydrogenase (NADP(+)) n=1 Tax=Allokutzneria sp. A3M-2-11 16 TaxID=2962043 RepID=UPI0020B686EF|nr:aldehyde dehydrogenase family protein [Allokutzneria sp. A3M-2-11 16]MCP3801627.1 aldehyde dehydrogenase (NADP(+)) [Allokutzneria sp. A3M-2-11 16]
MSVQGYEPRTGKAFGDPIPFTSDGGVGEIVGAAARAFPAWSGLASAERGAVLERLADALDAESEVLIATADTETALGVPRLTTELKRTTNQLRLFAGVLTEGSYREATIDSPNPGIIPPRPDLRRILQPLGVVAVFSASNFPFAFSVAGGDTASALAAGCSVVVKAHSAHPQTSRETARVVASVLPEGVFGIVYGAEAGRVLVQHPSVKAVGFTGSTAGGRALFDLAQGRPEPIPFYGELGSVNPVVVLPSAAANRSAELAEGFAQSLTMGVGQFCTNPGLLFAPSSIVDSLAAEIGDTGGGAMLTERMRDSYQSTVDSLSAHSSVRLVASGLGPDEGWGVTPRLYQVSLKDFVADKEKLTEECFGPAGIVVTYDDPAELIDVLSTLEGSLTATVHADPDDHAAAALVLDEIRRFAGRLVFNGWPTGVAVSWAMHHGGPWPATTSPLHTSVGATAIRRWLAPVTYQSWPDALLPPELQDANPLNIPRREDGVLVIP